MIGMWGGARAHGAHEAHGPMGPMGPWGLWAHMIRFSTRLRIFCEHLFFQAAGLKGILSDSMGPYGPMGPMGPMGPGPIWARAHMGPGPSSWTCRFHQKRVLEKSDVSYMKKGVQFVFFETIRDQGGSK